MSALSNNFVVNKLEGFVDLILFKFAKLSLDLALKLENDMNFINQNCAGKTQVFIWALSTV